MKLSKKLIRETEPGEKEIHLWDSALPGFGVRIKPSGAKTFVLQYRNRFNRSKRMTLGRVGSLTLDQGRKEAVRLRGEISLGDDPATGRTAARTGETLKDLSKRYMRDHCEGRCKPSTIAAHNWILKKLIIPKFGTYKMAEITRMDVAKYHQSLHSTPYNANRAIGMMRAMFNKAEEWGLIEHGQNPCRHLKPFRENKKNRFLSGEEYNDLFIAIKELEYMKVIDSYQAAAIRLLTFTGCRLNEILTLKWDAVDLANHRLILEHHKTDHMGAKAIPLNKAAVVVLDSLNRVKENPFVIVGKNGSQHLVNLQKPWDRIRKHAGLEGVRIHDLRHSFASAAASAGVPLQIIGGLLGHSSMQTTERYAHLSQDPVNQASESVGSIISGTITSESEAIHG